MVYNFKTFEEFMRCGMATTLMEGDVCIIDDVEYKHVGTFKNDSELPDPNMPCIWHEVGKGLRIRHKAFSKTGEEARVMKLKIIAEDDSPVTRERVRKDIFRSEITASDNRLKVVLKMLINSMNIDIKDYRPKFGLSEDGVNRMNNMRRLITSDANLTMEKFEEWLEILGARSEITVYSATGEIFKI